jgi:hypothetical protein
MEEDIKRTESNNLRRKGKQKTDQATGSAPQSHEPEVA